MARTTKWKQLEQQDMGHFLEDEYLSVVRRFEFQSLVEVPSPSKLALRSKYLAPRRALLHCDPTWSVFDSGYLRCVDWYWFMADVVQLPEISLSPVS